MKSHPFSVPNGFVSCNVTMSWEIFKFQMDSVNSNHITSNQKLTPYSQMETIICIFFSPVGLVLFCFAFVWRCSWQISVWKFVHWRKMISFSKCFLTWLLFVCHRMVVANSCDRIGKRWGGGVQKASIIKQWFRHNAGFHLACARVYVFLFTFFSVAELIASISVWLNFEVELLRHKLIVSSSR